MSIPLSAGGEPPSEIEIDLEEQWKKYRQLEKLAFGGKRAVAVEEFEVLLSTVVAPSLQARIQNDLGVLANVDGRIADATEALEVAISLDPEWNVPRENRCRLLEGSNFKPNSFEKVHQRRTRVAVLSLLFNWPSTGGGTVHTAEMGKFLTQAGYEVRHFYAQFPEWGLGNVTGPLFAQSEALSFTVDQWSVPQIQSRFRAALDAFEPDWVIITDSWNSKPILAEAASGYRFFLRIAAQECLCPLNNVRLLFDEGRFSSCPKHQLASPAACCQCVFENGKYSGTLHQAEREFVSYGTQEYDSSLRWAFANAEAVLVVNPLIEAMISPYTKKVLVIPSGFDAARFPANPVVSPAKAGGRLQILFAGLVSEPMKGFEVAFDACRKLWNERQDFEFIATADPPGQVNPFMRFIGWQTQASLPNVMREADMLVFPTIAEEALGRTAVEAMAAGRPVIASRIGGLQFTVIDGATGLLFEPGDSNDLARQIAILLDNAVLRERLGIAGRQRFEERFTWDSMIRNHYLPLLGSPVRKSEGRES